jgi:hypothetical protein
VDFAHEGTDKRLTLEISIAHLEVLNNWVFFLCRGILFDYAPLNMGQQYIN